MLVRIIIVLAHFQAFQGIEFVNLDDTIHLFYCISCPNTDLNPCSPPILYEISIYNLKSKTIVGKFNLNSQDFQQGIKKHLILGKIPFQKNYNINV